MLRPSAAATPSVLVTRRVSSRSAYGVQPLLQRGVDGRGETVVLPELAESQLSPPQVSDLRQDFAAFDHLFHLPAPRLRFVSTFAGPKDPWLAYGEEVLDAEMVHTIAPRAALTILLVKGTSLDSARPGGGGLGRRLAAWAPRRAASSPSARPARSAGSTASTTPSSPRLNAALQADADHHVTVVAATGDTGAAGEPCALIDALSGGISSSFTPRKEVSLVASDPLVLSAGGTTLDASHRPAPGSARPPGAFPTATPARGFQASGGGFSHLFRRPSYQNGVQGIGSMRGVPDVAADANPDPDTGLPVVTSNPGGGYTISEHGGTSASAPIWAGIIALADQYARRHLGFVNPAIYRIARSRTTTRPSTTSPPATPTRPSSPTGRSPATEQARAGTRSPAGAARTPRCSCPCSLATRAADLDDRPDQRHGAGR